MTEEIEVLLDVADRLDRAAVAYMVTGSMALNFYSRPRMTRDIDIVIELRPQAVDHLESTLGDAYFMDKASALSSFQHGPKMFNIIHEPTVIKIDFIVRKDLPYRREEFERRRYQDFFGNRIAVVSPEDLILSKLDWAKESRSELQLGDVKNILNSIEGLDIEYIERWAERLRLGTLWREVRA